MPVAVGLKETLTVQLAPAATRAGQFVVFRNCAEIVMPRNKGAVPVFVTTTG